MQETSTIVGDYALNKWTDKDYDLVMLKASFMEKSNNFSEIFASRPLIPFKHFLFLSVRRRSRRSEIDFLVESRDECS